MNTKIFILAGIAITLLGVVIFTISNREDSAQKSDNQTSTTTDSSNKNPLGNVNIVDGKQIITITAKGGYSPKTTVAKANIPTVIRMETRSTFDCSSALTIPAVGYRGNLPPSGETDIDIPAQTPGTKINGICSMGMYRFTVNFE